MDSTTLITSALLGGAAAGMKDTAAQGVKDAYGALKRLIQGRFRGRKEAEVALEQHEVNPELWGAVLRDQLTKTGTDRDEEILEAAKRLVSLLDPVGTAAGKYQVQFNAPVQGMVLGDHAHVTQTFGPLFPGNK